MFRVSAQRALRGVRFQSTAAAKAPFAQRVVGFAKNRKLNDLEMRAEYRCEGRNSAETTWNQRKYAGLYR